MGCLPSHDAVAANADGMVNETTATATTMPAVNAFDPSATTGSVASPAPAAPPAIGTSPAVDLSSDPPMPDHRNSAAANPTLTAPTVVAAPVPVGPISSSLPSSIPQPPHVVVSGSHNPSSEQVLLLAGDGKDRPARSTATAPTTKKLFNRLSQSVAHSSLAIQQSKPPLPPHNTSVVPSQSPNAATSAATAGDSTEDGGEGDDGTTVTALLHKITEGGEEAIHHLRNIFATPISFAVHAASRGLPLLSTTPPNHHATTMPHYPKTDSERAFLQTVLQNHYLFDSQSESSLQKLINAFEIYTIDRTNPSAMPVHDDATNTTLYHVPIIQQGDEVVTQPTLVHPVSNAYFYVVYHGKCQFSIDETVVGYANAGDAFGELALLYNGPRAATVTAILQHDTNDGVEVVVMEEDTDHHHPADGTHRSKVTVSSTISEMTSASESLVVKNNTNNDSKIDNDDDEDDVNAIGTTIVQQSTTTTPPTNRDYTVVLFRVHQRSFRMILQQDDQDNNDITMNLLNNIEFLRGVPVSVRENLARVMVPFPFTKGDHIVEKGIAECPWYVIERGTVLVTNLEHGYQDFTFTEGQCFGERAIMSDTPAIGDVYAEKDGVGFTVDHSTFKALIGNVLDSNTNVISRQQDCAKLKAIAILSSATQTSHRVLNYLSKQITDQTFPIGEVICRVGQPLIHLPSLYLVRKGKVRLDFVDKETIYAEMDAYFGEDQLQADMAHTERKGTYVSPYTATVIEECTCGILKLRDCRNVIDTRRMGEQGNVIPFDSLSLGYEIDRAITMKDLSVHRMIGAGTFGQVFLVSRPSSDGTERAYALKVQSKYELCQSGQAKGVVREKNIMTLFHHPFVAKLLAAFQDEKCVFMVMNLLQGGELYSIMHTKTSNVLPEQSAKFYVACVAEALFYLHCSHSLVFRDLKPENVMIDDQGYAILIDFGFCKKISGKTYTTCGTPLYLAPEVILNRGHSWSVDYWSLGIMIYEMLVGHTPFYEHGMNKAELFQNIVRGKVYPPTNVSPEVLSLLSGLLRRDPAKRLGSLIGNENDIIDHPWFSDIDRDRLFLKELDAPSKPQIKDPFDSSNFSSWKHVDDKRFVKFPALSPADEMIFKDF